MPRCSGEKADGTPCERIVSSSQSYCYAHDPARRQERRRNAARAGRSSGNRELVEIKSTLSDLTDQVLAGELATGRAAVAAQLINTRLRAVEVERRVREQDELEERLARLEEAAGSPGRGGGTRWGA